MAYLSFGKYTGINAVYDLINFDCEIIDGSCSKEIKEEMIHYFLSEKAELSKADKYCINLEKVRDMDCSGLSTLLIFSKLGKKKKAGIVLTNYAPNIEKLIKKTELDYFFELLPTLNDL